MQNIKLKISPCPNDTFIFYHFIHQNKHFNVETEFHDIEQLNQSLMDENADVIKASFPAWFKKQNSYELLMSGSAFGYGCGPLIVGQNNHISTSGRFLSPGRMTTANILFKSYLGKKPNVEFKIFNEIMPLLQEDPGSFGVIIHESRFTYASYGLKKIVDLGDWWETLSNYLPIPLGGIFIKKSLGISTKKTVQSLIQNSILNAYKNQGRTLEFCRQYSQEMESHVLLKHIQLYVNEYTYRLTPQCLGAIDLLRYLC